MKSYDLQQIIDSIKEEHDVIGTAGRRSIDNVSTPQAAGENSLIWIKPKNNTSDIITMTKAGAVICDHTLQITPDMIANKCFIRVADPKLSFIRIATAFFGGKKETGIHTTATISPDARIGNDVYVGPNTIIDEAVIGDGTVIKGNCFIGNKVSIGRNVFINAGVVIGSEGFGYSRNSEGVLEKFPHFGGVIIEDNVEIGANTCIDRGTLGDTWIKEGAKIDNLVHIAHNVIVGKNSLVIANAMVGGSTTIGDESWIAPSVNLMNGITIGDKTTIGMMALVTKNVPDGETWAGFPACPLDKYAEIQRKIKKL